jgi:hypothetical protein
MVLVELIYTFSHVLLHVTNKHLCVVYFCVQLMSPCLELPSLPFPYLPYGPFLGLPFLVLHYLLLPACRICNHLNQTCVNSNHLTHHKRSSFGRY